MAKKFKDFDKFFKEKQETKGANERPSFKMYGKVFSISSSFKAKTVVELLRMQATKDVEPSLVLDMLEGLLGKEQLNELLDNGITMEQLEDIMMWCCDQTSGDIEDDSEDGNFIEEKTPTNS